MMFVQNVPSCKHNKMVECPRETRGCSKCGWDPEVAKRRLQEFLKKHLEYADESMLEELTKKERD